MRKKRDERRRGDRERREKNEIQSENRNEGKKVEG